MPAPHTADQENYTRSKRAAYAILKAIKNGELTRPDTCELCGSVPEPIIYKRDTGQEVVKSPICAHHWAGHQYLFKIWWICHSCSCKLQGKRYHNGSVNKETARAIVMGIKKHVGSYKKPAITNVSQSGLYYTRGLTMTDKPKSTHGGKRPGAGRPTGTTLSKGQHRVSFGCRVDPQTRRVLEDTAARLDISLGRLVDRLTEFVDQIKP